VAQLTLAMVLSLACHLPAYNRSVEDGSYSSGGNANRLTPVYHELAGKTWGILGFGNIGRQVARVAEAMGCRVLVCKRTPVEDYDCVDMDTLCRESDILTIHTPLTEQTRGILSRERIATLKPSALVVNVARGAVVDEAALAEAVAQGRIGGIGVDVYSTEPFPADHPYAAIAGLDQVCLTPHMAWGAYEARVRVRDEMLENIRVFYAGGVRNRVDI
jgi:glycerate dehydrogenase